MSYTASMTEVQYKDPTANSSKFYRAYVLSNEDGTDNRVLFNWGRIGAKGQFSLQITHSPEQARSMAEGKIYDKTRKGYEPFTTRTLAVVPDDLLEQAGVHENVRQQAAARMASDPVARLSADTDRLVRLVTGPAEVQAEAITLRRNLDEQLAALRDSLTQAEGSLELVDDVMAMKLGA